MKVQHDQRQKDSIPNGIVLDEPIKKDVRIILPLPKDVKDVIPEVEIRILIPTDKKNDDRIIDG